MTDDTPKKPIGRPRIHPKKDIDSLATKNVKIKKFDYSKKIDYRKLDIARCELKELKAELKLDILQHLKGFLGRQLGKLDMLTDNLIAKGEDKQAVDAIFMAMEYTVPKLARTEHTGKDGKDLVQPPDFGNLTQEQRDELRGLIRTAMTPINGGELIPHGK